uniref:UBX domain-containing protein n=1 Tax=Oryza glumipatula TaxID=40148 RepID=A0A0D9YSZ2_9ORYZ
MPPTRVQDCRFSAAPVVELSDPSTAAAAAASMEMEQLTARFNDAVAVRGSNQLATGMEMAAAPGRGADDDMEELVARLVDVTVCDDGPAARGEAACAVRVRLPDGRVFDRVFGAARPVAALFRYCGAAVAACGMAGRPFRLVRLAGGASEEIPPRGDASLQDLRLDRCIVYVVFSP